MNQPIVTIVIVAAWSVMAVPEVRLVEHARGRGRATLSTAQDVQEGRLRGAYTIQQLSSGRYLDAHNTRGNDSGVVTRSRHSNATPRWLFRHEGGRTYTIQQEQTGRFLDAHDTADRDFAVVIRQGEATMTQRWLVTNLGNNVFTIQQLSTRRFLDAHETNERDFAVMTRPAKQTGTLVHLLIDKGFGFIRDEGGVEHFFHRSAVRGVAFELLREGQPVEFTPEESGKGPRAGDVSLKGERSNRTQRWILG